MSARDGHLGDHAAALVDGALGMDARELALSHITGCPECRTEVDAQRHLKERLRHAGDPTPSTSLTDRLRAIGTPSGTDTSRTLVPAASQPTAAVPAPPPMPAAIQPAMPPPTAMPPTAMAKPRTPEPVAGRRPGGSAPSAPAAARIGNRRTPRFRPSRRVTGSVGVVALGVAATLTLGSLRDQGPAVSPPVGAYDVEHARTTGGVPGADPGVGAVVTVSVNR